LRIGIDCSLAPGERAGVGQYSFNLAWALSRIDAENEYRLYPVFYHIFHPSYRDAGLPDSGNFRVAYRGVPERLLRLMWRKGPLLVKGLLLGGVDLVHSTTYCAPELGGGKKLVVTIYDVSFLTHPECHMRENIEHCMRGTVLAVKRADAIIAISEHTKGDLVRHFGASADGVTVTHLAAGGAFKRVSDEARLSAVRSRYGLPESFVLFVGSLEPRKNVETLFRAYGMLPLGVRRRLKLVVAGGRGWMNEGMQDGLGSLGISGDVLFAGYVAQEDLPALYSLATVFAYPSLYEGFGLPVLEAMACGCPVVASNVSSIPEVTGGAAMLLDPRDAEGMARSMAAVFEDRGLSADLSARGMERSSGFSWERCARETLEVYRRTLAV
jgi:glycosyltransferase involved in cell wall biosynthesis